MATQRIESGRAQISSPGGVPMRQVDRPAVNYIAGQVQAQTSSAMAQMLDRMSNVLFEEAGKQAVQEAKVDYFNMFRPDDSTVGLAAVQALDPKSSLPSLTGMTDTIKGSGIYAQALRKLQSADITGRFQNHADNEFTKILADVEGNRITSKQAADKMANVVNGFSNSISKLDAEAAINFQKSMGMRASVIMGKAFELDIKREKEATTAELQIALQNAITRLPTIVDGVTYTNAKGEVKPITTHFDEQYTSILRNWTPRVGFEMARSMANEYRKAARDAMIDGISRHINQEANLADTTGTLAKIRRGDLGKFSPLMMALVSGERPDEQAVQQIEKSFLDYVGRENQLRNQNDAKKKKENEQTANTLLIEYFNKQTTPTRKREIAQTVAGLQVFSIEQLEKFLDPQAKPGDPYVYANLETDIVYGRITDHDDLRRLAARAGMNGQQFQQLNKLLLSGYNREMEDAFRGLRRFSGVPDVASVFASNDDQWKIDKEKKVRAIFLGLVDDFQKSNPGKGVPIARLRQQAEDTYTSTDKASSEKTQARAALSREVADLVKKGKVKQGFVIDENTNVQDLVDRKILQATATYDQPSVIRKHIETLRK